MLRLAALAALAAVLAAGSAAAAPLGPWTDGVAAHFGGESTADSRLTH
jgi:hypothetical protein